MDEVDPELVKTFDKLGISLEEQKQLAGVAVDAVMDSVSNCPVPEAFIRKYVLSSIGQRTPLGIYTNEPSENTAELSAA